MSVFGVSHFSFNCRPSSELLRVLRALGFDLAFHETFRTPPEKQQFLRHSGSRDFEMALCRNEEDLGPTIELLSHHDGPRAAEPAAFQAPAVLPVVALGRGSDAGAWSTAARSVEFEFISESANGRFVREFRLAQGPDGFRVLLSRVDPEGEAQIEAAFVFLSSPLDLARIVKSLCGGTAADQGRCRVNQGPLFWYEQFVLEHPLMPKRRCVLWLVSGGPEGPEEAVFLDDPGCTSICFLVSDVSRAQRRVGELLGAANSGASMDLVTHWGGQKQAIEYFFGRPSGGPLVEWIQVRPMKASTG